MKAEITNKQKDFEPLKIENMTKVTILGQEPKEEKKLKPIEFVKYLNGVAGVNGDCCLPSEWRNIVLLSKDYFKCGHDLMLAYSFGVNNDACLYLGHFNDGVVE